MWTLVGPCKSKQSGIYHVSSHITVVILTFFTVRSIKYYIAISNELKRNTLYLADESGMQDATNFLNIDKSTCSQILCTNYKHL